MRALLNPKILEAFRDYSFDIDQFVKTLQFYSRSGS
jgi:hypothetical protein